MVEDKNRNFEFFYVIKSARVFSGQKNSLNISVSNRFSNLKITKSIIAATIPTFILFDTSLKSLLKQIFNKESKK